MILYDSRLLRQDENSTKKGWFWYYQKVYVYSQRKRTMTKTKTVRVITKPRTNSALCLELPPPFGLVPL